MAIEDMSWQLKHANVDNWVGILNLKLERLTAQGQSMFRPDSAEDMFEDLPALAVISGALNERFDMRNRGTVERILEATAPEGRSELEENMQAGVEDMERVNLFSINLSCIALQALSEPRSAFLPFAHAIAYPEVVAVELEKLGETDGAQADTRARAEATWDRIFDSDAMPPANASLAEYLALHEMGKRIGQSALRNFRSLNAMALAMTSSMTTFATLTETIDVIAFESQFGIS